jgi:uncharacterized protein YbjT (DUF2867 family)
MKVLIFGATGMVGHGVLRACLLDPDVAVVLTVGRTATGVQNPKLREIVHPDLFHCEGIESELAGFDACFFCLGQTSYGMTEEDYERVTYGITMAVAEVLCRVNLKMTFMYVSGAGTDSSEQGRSMWARVKGKTENALLRMPFAGKYVLRPGIIEPVHGARSKTRLYRVFLYAGQAVVADGAEGISCVCFDDRGDWAGYVVGGETRVCQASFGELGHSGCGAEIWIFKHKILNTRILTTNRRHAGIRGRALFR